MEQIILASELAMLKCPLKLEKKKKKGVNGGVTLKGAVAETLGTTNMSGAPFSSGFFIKD